MEFPDVAAKERAIMLRARAALLLLLAALTGTLRFTVEGTESQIAAERNSNRNTWIFQFASPVESDSGEIPSPLTPVHFIWPEYTPQSGQPWRPSPNPPTRSTLDHFPASLPAADESGAYHGKDLTRLPQKSLEASQIRGCFPVIASGPVVNSIAPRSQGDFVPPQVARPVRELPRPRIYGPTSHRSGRDYAAYVATVRADLDREAKENAYASLHLEGISDLVVKISRRITDEQLAPRALLVAEHYAEIRTVAANGYTTWRDETLARITRERALALSLARLSDARTNGGLAPPCMFQSAPGYRSPHKRLDQPHRRELAELSSREATQTQGLSKRDPDTTFPVEASFPRIQKALKAAVGRVSTHLSKIVGEFRTVLLENQATLRR